MSRLFVALMVLGLLVLASPASAYVWRCHTPSGDVWTSQPPGSSDCVEYDGVFNPSAVPQAPSVSAPPAYAPAPPTYTPAPAPAPPTYAYAYPYPYPYPYPVPAPYPYPYYPYYGYGYGPRGYWGGPAVAFGFNFRFGGGHSRWH